MRVYAMLVRDAEINTKRKGGPLGVTLYTTPLHDPSTRPEVGHAPA